MAEHSNVSSGALAASVSGGDGAPRRPTTPEEPPTIRDASPRSRFTQLIATRELSASIVLLAVGLAVGLGALHALEPGHGKTVVAAYLIGTRGTAWHALMLGLVVTASHTFAVYLLGGVTLYASAHVVPERLFPWVSAISGLSVAAVGAWLFRQRIADAWRSRRHTHDHDHGRAHHHDHDHPHGHDHGHDHDHLGGHDHVHGHDHDHSRGHDYVHGHDHAHGHDHDHSRGPRAHAHWPGFGASSRSHDVPAGVSLSQLFALGISGGIVPCPGALVVLLSAISLRRIGFGLVLIVAFSVGLAGVLTGIGLVMVRVGRMAARVNGGGPLLTRWLPLASSAAVAVLGLGIAAQALVSAGVTQAGVGRLIGLG